MKVIKKPHNILPSEIMTSNSLTYIYITKFEKKYFSLEHLNYAASVGTECCIEFTGIESYAIETVETL